MNLENIHRLFNGEITIEGMNLYDPKNYNKSPHSHRSFPKSQKSACASIMEEITEKKKNITKQLQTNVCITHQRRGTVPISVSCLLLNNSVCYRKFNIHMLKLTLFKNFITFSILFYLL